MDSLRLLVLALIAHLQRLEQCPYQGEQLWLESEEVAEIVQAALE